MNKSFTLNKFAVDSTTLNAESEWKFWLMQFQDFVQFNYVQDCKSYDYGLIKTTVKPFSPDCNSPERTKCVSLYINLLLGSEIPCGEQACMISYEVCRERSIPRDH
ncbi:hypothetical protein T11_2901 [Trichinella zimbabwensis]|uniref:Uncharacterized protein n=1 Tax=Trichinella zimbabwensis TaxID=268475 RepID=A0A0V1HWF1_9BILA|nr:hypothetical protein T11_2901 [Trichinella zimbabwensis]